MKILKKMIILLVASLAFVGCSTAAPVEEEAKVLRVAAPGDVLSLDSGLATDGFSFEVIAAFTEGLVVYAADDTIVPAVATSWEVSADGKEYVFTLDPAAKWSNGDPVTANDFVFAWQRLANPATASEYAIMLQTAHILNAVDVTSGTKPVTDLGVAAVDASTLKVTLDAAVPYFLQLMTFPSFLPLNQAFVEAAGASYATSPDTLLSNGPFVLTDWVQGSLITLAKNDAYVDADAVMIDGLEYYIIAESQTIKLEYEQDNLDVAAMTGDLVAAYQGTEDFTQIMKGYTWYLPVNQSSENTALANANFRLALAWSFDRSFIVDQKLNDGSIVANGFVPVGLSTGPTGNDFRTDAPVYFGYDVAKAQAYWETAKTELGVDSVTFELLVGDASDSGLASGSPEYLKAEIEKNLPGVTVNIVTTTKKDRLDKMKTGEFEVGLTRWGPDYADPLTYLYDLLVTGNTWNFSKWSNADYDALIASVSPGGDLATDLNTRWTKLIEAEALALESAVVIPVWQTGGAMIIKPNVSGIEYHVIGMTSYKNTVIE